MASVGESACTNKCKTDGQRELQEEAGKSKKKKYSCKYEQSWEKDHPFKCKNLKRDE